MRPFAAFARALGPSGGSSRSKRVQIHEWCKRSNGGKEPFVTDAADVPMSANSPVSEAMVDLVRHTWRKAS